MKKLIFLVAVACISGSYRNSYKLPAPFVGNYAHPIENHRKSIEYSIPHYVHAYGEIGRNDKGTENEDIIAECISNYTKIYMIFQGHYLYMLPYRY